MMKYGWAPINVDSEFYVVGGEYITTEFKDLVNGTAEEYGPFSTYDEARKEWRGKTGWKVDNCHHRLTIEERKRVENL